MENKATADRQATDRAVSPINTERARSSQDTAGAACRQHAAEMLRSRSLALQLRAAAKTAEARQALADAEALTSRSVQLRELAEECQHLRGPAEAALWDLAVESTRGV